MANTTHVTVRLPSELVAEIDEQARVEHRSRAGVILLRLTGELNGIDSLVHNDPRGENQRARAGAGLPILPISEGEQKRVHKMQPLRHQLDEQRDASAQLPKLGPESTAPGSCPHGKRNAAYCRATGGRC
jgi:hypothetical protein